MPVLPQALTTLAAVKEYLGITDNNSDDLLESLIDNFTELIENLMGGRRIKETAFVDEEHDGGEQDVFAFNLPIKTSPALTASFRTGTLAAPVFQDFTVEDFIVYPDGGFIHFFGKTPGGSRNISISYTAGFDPIPLDIDLLIKEMIAKEFNRRKSPGILRERVEGTEIEYANTQTQQAITPTQQATIDKYTRYNVGQNL